MPRARLAQSSLAAGELSPLLAARGDIKPYRNGAEALKNQQPLSQGGARTRPGTVYLATIPQLPAVLAEFVFSKTQRYAFVFSNARVDIYLTDGTLATSLTGAPWTTAMLDRLTWTQYGDTMLVFHPDLPTQLLKRTGALTFTRSAYAFEDNSAGAPRYQPYYKYADAAMTLTPSATAGAITLTLSGAGAWVAGHIGAIVRYGKKEILVTGVTNANLAAGTVRETLAATAASTDWDEQVFSDARGYANSGTFWLDRLWLGGGKSRPTGLYASKVGAYFNFDLGTQLDNEAIWESVAGERVSEILYVVGARHLVVLTDASLWYVPSTTAAPLTPKNFDVREQQPYGCAAVKPTPFDSATLFIQDTGAVVREALWIDTEQAYTANAVSLLAPHLISSPTALAVLYGSAARPEQYALLVNGDGNLSVFHSNRAENITAWVPWVTAGAFKSIATVGQDVLVLVERALAAGTVWTLEIFDDDAAALDCAKTATLGVAGKVFSGFSYLAGKTVDVSSSGHALGQYTVSVGGQITLDALAPDLLEIEAGFAFEQRLRPMPVDFDLPDGSSRGTVVDVIRTMVTVDRSAAWRIEDEDVLLEFAGDDFTSDAPTATGIIEVHHLGSDLAGQIDIVIQRPEKVTFLGVSREVLTGG